MIISRCVKSSLKPVANALSDAAVKVYFSKLEVATKRTLHHDTISPDAGVDVC